ncbi:UNVERIFIED_CONTAM: Retrovirus-related Pol polyprotein from transposon [Sesamum indicum]
MLSSREFCKLIKQSTESCIQACEQAPVYKPSYKPAYKARNENSQPRRLLTEAEMRARREKNLCYNCNEVFVPGHKCKVRYSYVLMNKEEVKAYEEDTGQLEEQNEGTEEEDVAVSLNAICKKLSHGTMRVKGHVNGREIQILVDSGSTHSFINEKLMKALDLKTEETTPMKGLSSLIQSEHSSWEDMTLCWVVIDWRTTTLGKEITLQAVNRKWEPRATSVGLLSELLGRKTHYQMSQLLATHTSTDQEVEDPMIQRLLQRFDDVFQKPQSLPPMRTIEHRIDFIPDAIPKKQPPYRYAYGQKIEIEQIVQEMLKSGIIRTSQSSFASPVLLVKKKDGGWRMCVDCRYLNRLTVKHKFPIPVIDELLDELHGAKFFTKIDLRSGYFQIRTRQEDISKISFITHSGHYEFLVMPFGLCKCSSHIPGSNESDYLGHIISDKGVATDPQKVQCMEDWPIPTTLKALRGFLDLTGYYRKFIKGYRLLSKPLTTLLKKDGFLWNKEDEDAFNHLKIVMSTAPVLALPDFTKPFIVETDACGKGIGPVLMQEGRPIAYLSKALAPKNLGLSTYEKEFLALLLAVTKWKHYLQGHHFIIRTDQKSLKHILDQRVDSVLQQRWVTKLLGLSYEVQYKKGNENRAANALSKVEHSSLEGGIHAISTQLPLWMQELQMSYKEDPLFQPIIQAKIIDNQSHPEYKYFAKTEATILLTNCAGGSSHLGVSLDMSTAYHPQTDGQTERVNQCLETYLRCMCHQHPKKWSQWITLAEFWLNKVKIIQLLKENLQNAQQRMKNYADRKRTEREFEVGDEVFLKLQPYKQASVALRKNLKLSIRYFGPYKVVERIGKVAYKLALPPESRIHPIFHVSLLKKKIGSKYIPSVNLPELEDEVYRVYPLAILARRLIPRNNVGIPHVLIDWSHSTLEQATLEDYHTMTTKFSEFDPWGEGAKKGRRNVMLLTENVTSSSSRWMKRTKQNLLIEGGMNSNARLGISEGNDTVRIQLG